VFWRSLGLITVGAHSTRSLKISGCKRWCPKDLRVHAPTASDLTPFLALACALALALALARTLTLALAKTVTTNALPDCNQLGNVRLRIAPKQWPPSWKLILRLLLGWQGTKSRGKERYLEIIVTFFCYIFDIMVLKYKMNEKFQIGQVFRFFWSEFQKQSIY
jgi:hypothetical protein